MRHYYWPNTQLVARRAANLGIKHLLQGREDKGVALSALNQRISHFMDAHCLMLVMISWRFICDSPCWLRHLQSRMPTKKSAVMPILSPLRVVVVVRCVKCVFNFRAQGLYEEALAPYLD